MRLASITRVSLAGGFVAMAMAGMGACSSGGGGGTSSSSSTSTTESSSSTTGDVGASTTPGGGTTSASASSSAANGSQVDGGSRLDASVREDASTLDATAGGDGADPLAAARQQCVQIINQDRASLATPSPALTEDTAEEPCVDEQAQADYEAGVAHHAFGNCKESAQDECPNWPGPPSEIMTKCLAQMWAEGPPEAGQDNHWLNMSNPKYTKVACGFYQTPSGSWWATQDFWVK